MGRLHHPNCRIVHELETLDGSEPEHCSPGSAVEGDAVASLLLHPAGAVFVVDARLVGLPRQRGLDWFRRCIDLAG